MIDMKEFMRDADVEAITDKMKLMKIPSESVAPKQSEPAEYDGDDEVVHGKQAYALKQGIQAKDAADRDKETVGNFTATMPSTSCSL